MASGTTAYLVRRALFLIPLLIGLSVLMFGLIHAAPGDPVRQVVREHVYGGLGRRVGRRGC